MDDAIPRWPEWKPLLEELEKAQNAAQAAHETAPVTYRGDRIMALLEGVMKLLLMAQVEARRAERGADDPC